MVRKISKAFAFVLALTLIYGASSAFTASAADKAPTGDASFLKLPVDVGTTETKNTHSGYMGFTFKAMSNISVTAMGRPDVIGGAKMTRDHEMTIWEVEWDSTRTEKSTPVLLATVTVAPTSPEYKGYRYENLETSAKLVSGREYIIVTSEYSGSDNWINGYNMTGKFDTKVAGEIDAVYSADYNGQNIGMQNPGTRGQGFAHDALNFWYVETANEPEPSVDTTIPSTPDTTPTPDPVIPSMPATTTPSKPSSTAPSTSNSTEGGGVNPFVILGICIGGVILAGASFFIIRGKPAKKGTDDVDKTNDTDNKDNSDTKE